MKKLLMLLASVGLTATTTASVIACGNNNRSGVSKTDLNDLHLTATIPGVESMTDTNAFDAFIQANANVSDLRENVSFGDFRKPEYKTNGSLTITAKPNTKYTGSITVTIAAIGQKALSGLGLNLDLDSTYDNEQTAFDAFLQANSAVTDLKDNVTHSDFVSSSYGTSGSLKISATPNGKYSGFVTLHTKGLAQTSLKDLQLVATIPGVESMTGTNAFDAFILANANVSDLRESVSFGDFKNPKYTADGSLTITAKPKTKYTGSITVTITAIGQKSLDSLHLHTTLSFPVTNQQAAFDSFISLNSEVSDLRDNLEITSFTAPDSNQTGTLIVASKADAKYSGTLPPITIPALNKTDLARLVTNTTIQGTANMTVAEAFQAFLTANSSWTNLSDYVDYDAVSFVNSSFKSNGSLTITAKAGTNYTGSIKITINAFEKDLSNLAPDSTSTVAVDLQAQQEDVFQAFLDKNQDILGNDLTLDRVDLTDFQSAQYVKNGSLTITVKQGYEWTGVVKLRIKFILTEANFAGAFNYLSDNDLLKFDVSAGEVLNLTSLIYIADRELVDRMKQFYEYDKTITGIYINNFGWHVPGGGEMPSIEQLNTPGNILHLPNFAASVYFQHPVGDETHIDFSNVNVYWNTIAKNS